MYAKLVILMLVCNLLYAQQPEKTEEESHFYLKSSAGENWDKLYYNSGKNGQEKLLFDPGTWRATDEKNFVIKNFSANADERLVCIAVGTELSDKSTLIIVDVSTGKILEDLIFNCSGSCL